MTLLISDTNIFIDFEEGELIDELFCLAYTLGVPDLLYEDELREQHADLLARGLKLLELDAQGLSRIMKLGRLYPQPSRLDLAALVTAEQNNCALVTGDRNLRRAAKSEGIQVYGTLWICEQLVHEEVISVERLALAYKRMRERGRRLPKDVITAQLRTLRGR